MSIYLSNDHFAKLVTILVILMIMCQMGCQNHIWLYCGHFHRGTKLGVWSFLEETFYLELISSTFSGAYCESWVTLLGPPLSTSQILREFPRSETGCTHGTHFDKSHINLSKACLANPL